MTTDLEKEREAFEAAYAAHLNKQPIHARIGAVDFTRKEVAGMRAGDAYSDGYAYLNGCWAGWKFGRAALAAPASATHEHKHLGVASAEDQTIYDSMAANYRRDPAASRPGCARGAE